MKIRQFLLVVTLILSLAFTLFPAGKKVGVIYIGKSGMSERVITGFAEFLGKKAPEIEIVYKKELPDQNAAMEVYKKFQEEMDGIVFLKSSGAEFLAKNPPKKPAFVGACTNPVELGVTADLETPGKNITGVTYYEPVERQIKLLRKAFPNLKKLGLLVQEGHPSTRIDLKETKAACDAGKIDLHSIRVDGKNQLELAVKSLVAKNVDIIVLGNQGLLIDNSQIVARHAGKTPVVSYSEKPVTEKHVLCGLVPDDAKLGRMLGDAVMRVIKYERDVSQVPFRYDQNPRFIINIPLMKKLGISIPDALMKDAKKID